MVSCSTYDSENFYHLIVCLLFFFLLENAEKIHKAAKQGNWEELRMFLGKGLDLEVKDKFGKTPLHTGKDTDFFCFRFFFFTGQY